MLIVCLLKVFFKASLNVGVRKNHYRYYGALETVCCTQQHSIVVKLFEFES